MAETGTDIPELALSGGVAMPAATPVADPVLSGGAENGGGFNARDLGLTTSRDFLLLGGYPFAPYAQGFRDQTVIGAFAAKVATEPEPPTSFAGGVWESGGETLWNRVLVSPEEILIEDIVQEELHRAVTVWSTFGDAAKVVSGVDSSASGVGLGGSLQFPLALLPMCSRQFDIVVSQDGDLVIDGALTWVIADVPGVDVAVTGTRFITSAGSIGPVFSLPPDWSEPVRERLAWLTDVMRSYNGREQRTALRSVPRVAVSYRGVALGGREAAILSSLLYGGRTQARYIVPLWHCARKLAATAAPGDQSVSVDTLGSRFAPGGYCVIWRGVAESEFHLVGAVDDGGLELAGTYMQGAWAADGDTLVIPAMPGVLTPESRTSATGSRIAAGGYTFDCEAV
jgi:hypothetical protein